jgi:hypothetical protein
MLAKLLEVPHDKDSWDVWSYHHRLSHEAIRDAIQHRNKVNLPTRILEPVFLDEFESFLENNQQAHVDMDGALRAQSADLQDVDIKKPNELEAWIYIHYQEHFTAEQALGI